MRATAPATPATPTRPALRLLAALLWVDLAAEAEPEAVPEAEPEAAEPEEPEAAAEVVGAV